MLGDAGNAYRRKGAPDEASLRRGVDVLRRVPFGILEAVTQSYLLLAHAFSSDRATCARLYDRFHAIADHGSNVHGVNARTVPSQPSVNESARSTVFANATLRDAFERSNGLDRRLYEAGIVIFCGEWARARKARHSWSCLPDLASDIGDPDVCRGVDRWATNRLRALYPPFH